MTPENARRRVPAAERRAMLIDEAASMLAEVGYHRLSLTELAAVFGMTRPGVTHHVGSKATLLLEVLTLRDRRGFAAMREVLHQQPGDLRAALDAQVRTNIEEPELVRLYTILCVEALEPSHPASAYFRSRWEEGVQEMTALLVDVREDARAAAERIYSFLDGLQINWLRDPSIDMWAQWSAFADDLGLPPSPSRS